MSLRCLAGYGRERRPKQIFCPSCWQLVPRSIQDEVYRTFGNGLSGDWMRAFRDAKEAVKSFSPNRATAQTLEIQ